MSLSLPANRPRPKRSIVLSLASFLTIGFTALAVSAVRSPSYTALSDTISVLSSEEELANTGKLPKGVKKKRDLFWTGGQYIGRVSKVINEDGKFRFHDPRQEDTSGKMKHISEEEGQQASKPMTHIVPKHVAVSVLALCELQLRRSRPH